MTTLPARTPHGAPVTGTPAEVAAAPRTVPPAPEAAPDVPAGGGGGAPLRVLYVAGMPRSGSTLLERMLGALPGVCGLGEVVWLWSRGVRENARCGCGEHFWDCPFWQGVGEQAFGGWSNVDPDRMDHLRRRVDDVKYVGQLLVGRGRRGFRDELAEYTDAFRRVYAAARDVSGAEIVIDSSKHTSLAYCLRHVDDLDLRMVHLVRDSRGVAYSWTKKVRAPEFTARPTYMARLTPARIALLWNGHNVLIEVPRLFGTKTLLLRYEAFAEDPRPALAAVQRLVGLDPGTAPLDFVGDGWADLAPSHSVSGNPMRFTSGRIPLRRDDAWRSSFPVRQRRLVTAMTAPVAGLLGYRPSRGGSGR